MRHRYPAFGVYMAPDSAPWEWQPEDIGPTGFIPFPVPSVNEADIRRIIREELERLKAEELEALRGTVEQKP